MNKKKLIPFLLVLLIGSGAYWVYRQYYSPAGTSIKAAGTIEATTVDLTAKAAGTIIKMTVQEGDKVKKGQLLAQLTRSDLAAQRERDAMAVLAAEANLNNLASGSRSQEIKEAVANVSIAQTNYDKAKLDLQRAQQLYDQGAIAQESLDEAQVNHDLKKSQLDAVQARLSLLEAGNRPQVLAQAGAELARSKAVLAATETMLQDMMIYAPLNGTVLSKNYEEGEYVQTGAALYSTADLDKLWIRVYIPTDDLPSVKLGDQVGFTVSGSPTTYRGKVTFIASQGEFTPKTIQTPKERTNVVFAVKITVDNKDGTLKPGMPADVVFKRTR